MQIQKSALSIGLLVSALVMCLFGVAREPEDYPDALASWIGKEHWYQLRVKSQPVGYVQEYVLRADEQSLDWVKVTEYRFRARGAQASQRAKQRYRFSSKWPYQLLSIHSDNGTGTAVATIDAQSSAPFTLIDFLAWRNWIKGTASDSSNEQAAFLAWDVNAAHPVAFKLAKSTSLGDGTIPVTLTDADNRNRTILVSPVGEIQSMRSQSIELLRTTKEIALASIDVNPHIPSKRFAVQYQSPGSLQPADVAKAQMDAGPTSRSYSFAQSSPLPTQESAPAVLATRWNVRARNIMGDAQLFSEQVKRLTAFVYRHLDKVDVLEEQSALEILRSGQGDCTEHVRLLSALMSSLNWKTREVTGLLLDEATQRLTGHVWLEVKFNGNWYAVDPTWNRVALTQGYIRLGHGDEGMRTLNELPETGTFRISGTPTNIAAKRGNPG